MFTVDVKQQINKINMTAADDIHRYFFIFSEKMRLDISNESQRIHMKNQALFSSKGESKELKCRLLQFLLGPLRVNMQL